MIRSYDSELQLKMFMFKMFISCCNKELWELAVVNVS